jgi:hypothetical protein
MARTHRSLATSALVAGMILSGTASASEMKIHGLLDLVVAPRGKAYDYNVLTRGDSPFDAYSARIFADASVSDRLSVFTQVALRDAATPYVDGLYMIFTPMAAHDLHVQAGKVPWAIGTFAPRTYSDKNPLIGTPLMYQYHTSLVWYETPDNADQLISSAGLGQYGVNYEGYAMSKGMATIDDSFWDVGFTIAGSERPLEYAIGMIAGTPGWASTSQDENSGKTVLGRLGLAPAPWIRFGASGAYGPYMHESLNPKLPTGRNADDYHQTLAMADFELQAGHLEVHAEGAHNIWQTPFVGDLKTDGGYVELKYSLPFGTFIAGRADALRFGEVTDSLGVKRTWDANVTRGEAGLGYRFDRHVQGKVVYQHTEHVYPRDVDPIQKVHLVAMQVSIAF